MGDERENMGHRWRTWTILLLAALLLAALLWYVFGPGEDKSLSRIFESGVMRVGMDPSFPPFENLDVVADEVRGYDVDLAQALADQLGGVRPQFVIIGFDGLYDALWARKVDLLISALPVDPMLTKDVAYSTPYFNAGLRLLTLKGGSQIENLDALTGQKLAVEWGSEGDLKGRELRQRVQGLELVSFLSSEEALDALLRGEVDAMLVEGVAALQFAGEHEEVALFGELLTDQPYAVAIHPKDKALHRAINQALGALRTDGTLARLEAKWFGPSPP
ncbi:MAG: substrate-binding periplasmic protein [Anaerolineae bacterium]